MSQQPVPFHPEEFRALKTTIGNYLDQMVPPSAKRNRLMTVLQGVHVRLRHLLALGQKIEGQRFWLTDVEVMAIDMALVAVARLVRLIIEPSGEQEDTVLALDKMRWRVRMLVFPRQH
ncbi:MAG: hypothetical protein JO125_07115 [Chloroflexi bacterium]|nr:hypothetical protein [Ktedonobacteraceae bacterium]MBV9707162.1 hypothetical protein [Chloroflexota bacterium]